MILCTSQFDISIQGLDISNKRISFEQFAPFFALDAIWWKIVRLLKYFSFPISNFANAHSGSLEANSGPGIKLRVSLVSS